MADKENMASNSMNGTDSHKKPCVVMVATRGFSLYSSRRLLIQHVLAAGYQVVIATSDDEHSRKLVQIGAKLVPVCFGGGVVSLYMDMRAMLGLWMICRRYKPILIHHFNIKPLILGSLASLLSIGRDKRKVVNTITGLGNAFVINGCIKWFVGIVFKLINPAVAVTIFQNRDDHEYFLAKSWIEKERSRLVIGSGVDIQKFSPAGHSDRSEKMRVLMVSRLIRQKGVLEYIEMASILNEKYNYVSFQLGGEICNNHPDAVPQEIIDGAVERGVIDFVGYIADFDKQLANVSIFVFPSYYREGVPRVVMESAASGVPVVGADVPGTREAIIDNFTGFLVPAKDSGAIAERVGQLIEDCDLRHRMGVESRKLAESNFDIRMITQQQLEIYGEVGIRVENDR